MNREEWLIRAVEKMGPYFMERGYPLSTVRVSVGWPHRARKLTIGQCFVKRCASDEVSQIFISPVLADPIQALETLVHELLHAAMDCEGGHGAGFVKGMRALGLSGKPTATIAGPELREWLKALNAELGDYPHAALNPTIQTKKQTTRLLKVECGDCGYTARVTAKWLDSVGAPICPCNHEHMNEGKKEEGDK